MAHICLVLTISAVLILSQGVSAKRGCSAFGHSCFGGHGKRSGDSAPIEVSNRDLVARQSGQEETPPHPGYPRSGYNNMLLPGDDIIPVRDGGVYERDDNTAREVMKYKLNNIIKHWMDSYRRNQQNLDNGFYVDNL